MIYDRLRVILERTGASLGHLAKVNAYFNDAADIPFFQRIGALALDGAVHATATVPVKRLGEPSEIGETVAWLCSDHASYVTGLPMPVDGGFMAQ